MTLILSGASLLVYLLWGGGGGGGGGEYYHYTPMCSGQYREAPSKKGTFFRPGEYKRLGKDSQAGVQ